MMMLITPAKASVPYSDDAPSVSISMRSMLAKGKLFKSMPERSWVLLVCLWAGLSYGGVVPGTGPKLAVVHGGETVVPAGAGGTVINLTINAGLGADGAAIGKTVVEWINKYTLQGAGHCVAQFQAPAGVAATPREWRSKSGPPSALSRSRRRRLAAGSTRLHSRAASVRFPVRAHATASRMDTKSKRARL